MKIFNVLVYQLMQSDMISCRLVGLIKQKLQSENEQISKEIQTFGGKYQFFHTNAVLFSASLSKIMDFKENGLFQENEQNEHISMKLLIPMDFQKRAFYHLLYLSEILPK